MDEGSIDEATKGAVEVVSGTSSSVLEKMMFMVYRPTPSSGLIQL